MYPDVVIKAHSQSTCLSQKSRLVWPYSPCLSYGYLPHPVPESMHTEMLWRKTQEREYYLLSWKLPLRPCLCLRLCWLWFPNRLPTGNTFFFLWSHIIYTLLQPDLWQLLSIAPRQAAFPWILSQRPYWLGSQVPITKISHYTIHTLLTAVSWSRNEWAWAQILNELFKRHQVVYLLIQRVT